MSTEQHIEEGTQISVASKNQKKALKALKGSGIKKVEGINRVIIRKGDGTTFIVADPEVYRTPNGSYIVLGEPSTQEDVSKQLEALTSQASAAAEADKSPESIEADLAANAEKLKEANAAEEEDIPDDQVDTTGLDADTIAMVQDQGNVSKAKAVAALRANNGDLVNTLMQLTV
ncbi:Egd2 protein [Starmerella bacillaris]|uniref:Nascent polypeptide-associated complex subunit alpha n=1 Tax=Starmerella bacillaris TaxID=1247836 RepID=A0AAV5RI24_STABA|nr:Egd2 protein [Starmerella bacillaris]